MDVSEQHPIFTKDPGQWMSLIHKQVLVTCVAERQHVGWVYTVDPVSESIALVEFDENSKTVKNIEIIPGHAVKDIKVVNEDCEAYRIELNAFCKSVSDIPEQINPETLKKRQRCLQSWLEKNRLPVSVNGERNDCLTVADVLLIEPPYGPDNCIGTNEIILGRIQGLIKNMPVDHETW